MSNVQEARDWPIPALDILRALAASSVVLHHFSQQFLPIQDLGIFGEVLSAMGGWGVTVFFVLSGFLIHAAALREEVKSGRVDWKLYGRRRFFRIIPPYFLALVICSIVGLWWRSNVIRAPTWIGLIEHFSLLSSFDRSQAHGINGVFWSVVVECHFYLLYPLVWVFRRRLGIPFVAIAIFGMGLGCFAVAVIFSKEATRGMLQQTAPVLFWHWILGAVLAEMYIKGFAPRLADPMRSAALTGLALIACFLECLIQYKSIQIQFERFVMPFFCALIVGGIVFSPIKRLRSPFLEHLGHISYSIYLLHPLALLAALYICPNSRFLSFVVTVFGTYFLASLSYHFVERPCLRLGHRSPSESGTVKLGPVTTGI